MRKERLFVGNAVQDKESQVDYLKQRLNMFLNVLDAIEPEHTELEDIDRLIQMIDDLEAKCEQFKKKW
jgi:ribosome biogenesis GTPase A